jgi:hypothetical protein
MYILACVSVFTKNCGTVRCEFDIQKVNVVFVYEFCIYWHYYVTLSIPDDD